jgi:hypothetical protein
VILREPENMLQAGSQASFCPRRKKRPREESHASGVAELPGNVSFGPFLCAKEKDTYKKRKAFTFPEGEGPSSDSTAR